MFVFAALVAAAGPIPLAASWSAPRNLQVDLWSFGQAYDPWGSDWASTTMEQWSVALICTPVAKRTESCTLHGNTVTWSYVKEGTDQIVSVPIEMPATIELRWAATGRLAGWDVKGDRERFHAQASNAFLKALFHRPDMVFKPDSAREIGTSIEQSLCRKLASALEIELPKSGTTEGGWVTNVPLWAGRRYAQGTSTAKIDWRAASQGGALVDVTWQGDQSEASPDGSYQVATRVVGQATFDTAAGTPTAVYHESAVTGFNSTGGVLSDHTRFMSHARPFTGDAVAPMAMPEPRIVFQQ